jgi:hypothetical protein
LGQAIDEGHVAIQKGVLGHEGVNVRARKYSDLPARTVEVGGDGIFWVTRFVLCNIDVAKSSGACSRGDAEDNAHSWMQLLGGGVVRRSLRSAGRGVAKADGWSLDRGWGILVDGVDWVRVHGGGR